MPQRRVFQNAKWIIVCKAAQSLLQMVIGMISARYLGPSGYGLINYAASVTAFAIPVMQLGMNFILVQEYVAYPDKEGEILGTSLVMNFFAGIICMCGVVCFASIVNRGETVTIYVCAIYSVILLAQALEMVQYWFQAKLLSKYSSIAMLVAYVLLSAYKIYILIAGKSIFWFALSHAVELGTAGLLYILLYLKIGTQRLAFSVKRAKDMLSRGKYYVLSALMVTVYQSTDHVMLKLISGDAENGYYTTAITCSIVVAFVYYAIIDSARPAILEARKETVREFEKRITSLYSIILYLTLTQGLFFVIFAKPIVWFLYGAEYLNAVPVLRILVWQVVFNLAGWVRSIWILGEEKHSVLWKINLCGVIANVILNALMIPVWGACGAAFASVLTQFVTNFVVGFFMKSIRRNNYLLLKGFDPRYLVELVKQFLQK